MKLDPALMRSLVLSNFWGRLALLSRNLINSAHVIDFWKVRWPGVRIQAGLLPEAMVPLRKVFLLLREVLFLLREVLHSLGHWR